MARHRAGLRPCHVAAAAPRLDPPQRRTGRGEPDIGFNGNRGAPLTSDLSNNREVLAGIDLLTKGRQQALRHGDLVAVTMADIQIAEHNAYSGDVGAAIEIAAATVEHL